MPRILRDVLFHLRTLRRRWPFTVLIVLCLALGVGANSTVFSVVNAVLIRPLPFKDPDRLIILLETLGDEKYNAGQANLAHWRKRCKSFTSLEAMETLYFNVADEQSPVRLPGGAVSAGLFPLLGVKPMIGRLFDEEEDLPGGPRVALVSYKFFQEHLGGDPKALDKPLLMEGQKYDVVGVMPPGAESFFPRRFIVPGAEIWVPLQLDKENPPINDQNKYLYVVGRLAKGVDLAGAKAEMKTVTAQLAEEFPDTNAGWGVAAMTVRQNWVGQRGRNLLLLLAAVGFVLLIACANVSNLLLARAAEQQGQMALRMAFGAGRGHLFRQFLTESVLLALMGGVVGGALCLISLRLMPLMLPTRIHHQLSNVQPDLRVFLFTFAVALLAGVVPGMLAAWRISSLDLLPQLTESSQRVGTGVRGRRLRDGLVAAEIALTLVLLIGAGLMLKSLGRLGKSTIGFDPENLLTFAVVLPEAAYSDDPSMMAFFRKAKEEIKVIPGVESVAVTGVLPVTKFSIVTRYLVENRVPEDPSEVLMAEFRQIDPNFFDTMAIPLREGRGFTDSDTLDAAPVAIVSAAIADRFWPGGNALGQRIIRFNQLEAGTWMTIVGVADEVQESDMGTEIGKRGSLYTPYTQVIYPDMYMVARTTVDPTSLIPSIRQAIRKVDPIQPIAEVKTMEQRISDSLSDHRFETIMLMIFSGLSVVLALVGIYGVVSYSVSQRTQEMGLRMAMGATARDILVLILRQTLTLALIGLTVGVVAAYLLSHVMSTMLYDVEPTDPQTFVAMIVALVLACFGAGLRPAWRASRHDPAVALRYE